MAKSRSRTKGNKYGDLSRYVTRGKFRVEDEPDAEDLRKQFSRFYPKLKEWTTPSSAKPTPPPDVVAGQGDKSGVHSAASSTLTQGRTTRMADNEELSSIVEFSEDITDAPPPNPLPSSEYEAEIKGAEPKFGVQSGKKYAAVTFHIPVDQFPPDYPVEDSPDGVSIIYRMVPLEDNPRSRFRCRLFCEAIGAKPGKTIDLNDWVGLTAKVGTQVEKFEGLDREVITKVSAL